MVDHQRLFTKSLLTAIGAVIAFLGANLFNLSNPFWSVITVIMVFGDVSTHPVNKGILRIVATIFGALLGLVYVHLFINSQLIFFLGVLVIMTILTYRTYHSPYPYAWLLGGLTYYMVVAVVCIDPDKATVYAYWRCIEISLGVTVTCLLGLILKDRIGTLETRPNPPDYSSKRAIKASISCLITLLLFLHTNWYNGVVGVVSSQLVVYELHHGHAKRKAFQRLFGCGLGALVGLCYLHVASQTLIGTLTFMAGVFFLSRYLQGYLSDYRYLFLQASFALALALIAADNQTTESLIPALHRLAGIFLGIMVALAVNYCLWPSVHEKEVSPALSD